MRKLDNPGRGVTAGRQVDREIRGLEGQAGKRKEGGRGVSEVGTGLLVLEAVVTGGGEAPK
jgi:hypothetical protein